MKELSFSEINEVSGAGSASEGLALTAGSLAVGAVWTMEAPPVSAFLALGAGIMTIASVGASMMGY